MKFAEKILIFVSVIFIFSGCLSEEQKKMKLRIEKLDNQIENNRDALQKFFDALQKFKSISKSAKSVEEFNSLKPSDTLAIRFLSQYFDSIQIVSGDIYKLKPPIVFIKNALPIRLNSESTTEISETQIQNIGWIDKQLVWKIYYRLKNDEWEDEISSPASWETEEAREKNAQDYGEMIKTISDCSYLLGVEDVFVKSAKVIDKRTFESGFIFSKIHIFDLKQTKIVAQYFTLNKNSGIVFADTLNAESQSSDLDSDLKQEVFGQLKRRFENRKK